MLQNSFKRYLEDVEKAARDCAAAVRRLVNKVGDKEQKPQCTWLLLMHLIRAPHRKTTCLNAAETLAVRIYVS